jgi:pimeloyl-ACP methyl ester carboxylesterase
VHTFGKDGTLVGIVSFPASDDGAPSAERPFVIVLNAGLVHRVGPFGMSVQIARRLAAQGFRVLRFDQSGTGDSTARPAALSVEEHTLLDGREALDFLEQRYGAKGFVIGGLCSGALNAHWIGAADQRVVGLYLLDGYAYPTRAYPLHRVTRILKRPRTWLPTGRNLARRVRDGLVTRARPHRRTSTGDEPTPNERDELIDLFYREWPDVADTRRDLERMLARGARVLFVYSGGWSKFVHVRQFDAMFPGLKGRERVTVRYHPLADHMYTALDDRDRLLRDIGDFVSHFG